MYAVIETGGKQYRVSEGDEIFVEKLGVENGEVNFDKVVMVGRTGDTLIGAPYVPGAVVKVSRTERVRRLTFSPISPRRAQKEQWVTDSPTAR